MNGAKYILLVEDNPDDADLTLRALKKNNIANPILTAQDGAQALELLHGKGERGLPALVLLDIKLPKIDGLEVLRRIRADARTARTPVVILTTSTEKEDLITGYNNGANSYIRKPVDYKQFAEAVKQLGLYWLVLNEPPPEGL